MPTALIADDEPLLRAQLRDTLTRLWPALRVVAEAGDGESAVRAVADHRPDFAFLDIEMPGMNGLDAAHEIKGLAHVVFVTAYQQYAIDAFDRGALDYVLKPASEARLAETVERLKVRTAPPAVENGALEAALAEVARALGKPAKPKPRWIQAAVGQQVRLIRLEDVLFFQSDLKYTRIVTTQGEALVRRPLKDIVEALDAERFWQVHRSTVVNTDAVLAAQRDEMGGMRLVMRGCDEKPEVSRTYQSLFRPSDAR